MSKAKSGWRRTGIGCAVVLLALVAGVAQAVVIRGVGQLSAAGNGLAVIELRGGLVARGIGLAIVEEEALAHVEGHGRITPIDDGRLLLEGFGRMVVRSPDERTRVEIAGARLRLRARGVGVAFLKGVGHFMTDDVDGRWEPESEVEFDSEASPE